MGNPFDQLGKKIGLRALGSSGRTAAQHEIPSPARQADLRHEPDPAREAERARLGLLGRLASVPCLLEMFSRAPGEEMVLDCVGKVIAYRQERRREAKKLERRRRDPQERGPAPPLVKPSLWIITADRPTRAISMLGAVQADGWPTGVYMSPGGMLRVGIVVAGELPRDRTTILVRIMAGGSALSAAVADLAALPAGAYERDVASKDVLELWRVLNQKSNRTKEEEAFIVDTQDGFEELREEGREEGRHEGLREGRVEARAGDILTVLRVRGVAVPEAMRERILAQKDPERLERWLEKAAVATSLAEVLDEPS
jgi:hypothetical protein